VLLRKDLQLGLSAGKELGVRCRCGGRRHADRAGHRGRLHRRRLRHAGAEQARRSGYAITAENVPVDDGLAPEVTGEA